MEQFKNLYNELEKVVESSKATKVYEVNGNIKNRVITLYYLSEESKIEKIQEIISKYFPKYSENEVFHLFRTFYNSRKFKAHPGIHGIEILRKDDFISDFIKYLNGIPVSARRRTVLKHIYSFYNNVENEKYTNYSIDSIHEVKVLSSGIVKIVTTRPGLIIGKAGRSIDALSKYINNELKDENFKEVKLELEESKLWTDLY